MVQWIVNIHAKWLLSCTLLTNRMSLRILSIHILFWHFSYLTFLRILAHCVSRSRAWAYEYMRKSKWDIHTWEFHPSSPAGMQHCSRRTGKILMEKKVENFLRKLHSAIFIQIRRPRSLFVASICFAKWCLFILNF